MKDDEKSNMFIHPSKLSQKMHETLSLLYESTRNLTQQEKDQLHEIPISKMGDYHNRMTIPLRNPLESDQELKQREKNMFGNPYKKPTKKQLELTALDEFEDEASIQNRNISTENRKRHHKIYKFKKPLPKLFNGAIYIPPLHLHWTEVSTLFAKSKAMPVDNYEPLIEVEEDINTAMPLDDLGPTSTNNPPSLLSQSPIINGDERIHELAPEILDSDSTGRCSSSVSDIDMVFDEPWYVTRQRLHRSIYKWGGDYDPSFLHNAKSEQELNFINENLILLHRGTSQENIREN